MNQNTNRVRIFLISSTLIILLFTPNASGTVIYVRVSGDEAIIAADSKRLVFTPDGNTVAQSVCKILPVGDIVLASGGIAGDTRTDFDVGRVAIQAMSSSGTLIDRVRSFERLIQDPLFKTLAIVRTHLPDKYKAFLKGAAVNTVFMRVENQAPVVAASSITPIEKSDGTMALEFTLKFYSANHQPREETLSMGESPRADLAARDKDFWNKGPVAGVRELMELSIADNPRETGEPIDILQFSKSGTTWVQVKPGCNEIKKFPK